VYFFILFFDFKVRLTVGGTNGTLAPMATFFEVAVFFFTVNGAVRFGRLRIMARMAQSGRLQCSRSEIVRVELPLACCTASAKRNRLWMIFVVGAHPQGVFFHQCFANVEEW